MKTKWREIIAVVIALLLISLVITGFSAWDNDLPADNQSWNTAMRDIRYNWDALEVELGINLAEAHPYYQAAAPTKKPDGTTSFDSDDLGRIWIDSDDNAIYVLTATTPTWTAVFISLANDTYFTAIDNAGTGTVNLIKATTGDIPEILVGAVLSADTAPAVDAGIANKKYVDDQDTAVKSDIGLQYDGTQVYNANSSTSFTDLNLSSYVGSNRAFVHLKIKNTGADETFWFRTNGDAENVGVNTAGFEQGTSATRLKTNMIAYISLMTDASGIIEWKGGAVVDIDIWLLLYMKVI